MPDTKAWEEYQNGLTYQKTMKFNTDFPMYIRFKEGDQWAPKTERTKHLPRPVFNIVKMFIRAKRSSILNQPVSINYTVAEVCDDTLKREFAHNGAQDFSDYARQLWRRCEQDKLNAECLDDAATLGTGIFHYYFDAGVKGGTEKPYIGEIRGETLDPLNVIFGNPQDRNVQSQPYIIIAQRKTVDEVKAIAESEGCKRVAEICGDEDTADEGYDAAQHEMRGQKKCTLLTRYYRKEDGAIYFDKATKGVDVIKERCLTPEGRTHKICIYPIEVMNWEIRKKCIFGIGEAVDLIPTQKAINFLKAMEVLSVQQVAWPKVVSKPNALNQPITNEPGEHLIDHCQTGQGIYYLNPPVMSAAATNLVSTLFDLQRTVSGVSEVSTGEPIGASIAASAIIALQNQAKTPIEEVQKRFYRCIQGVGKIWEELIKAYYHTERNITVDSPEKDELDKTRPFTGTSYADCEFDLQIDVGASSEYGEVLAQATLDKLWERGDITTDEYIELAPHNVIPFKERLKQMREKRGANIEAQLQQITDPQQLQQIAQTAMQMSQQIAPSNAQNEIGTPGMTLNPAGAGATPLPAIPKAPTIPSIGGGA